MLIMLALLFGAMSAASAADRFYIDAVNVEPGETRQLAFILENSQTFYGFQADITLPEGLEFVRNNGKVDLRLSSRADGYTTVSNLTANGTLRVGAFSASHTAISGDDGELLYVNVRASDDFAGGVLAITNILMTDASDNDVSLPDFSIDLGTKHVNNFYIPDFKIAVGETKSVSVILDNETPFTAFQTDMYLPEGLEIVAGSFKFTDRALSGHTLSTKSFSDGRTRIICMSLSNEVFAGSRGALLDFEITATNSVSETAEIQFKDQIFSTPDAHEYVLPDSQAIVTLEKVFVESITLDASQITVETGQSVQLEAVVYPEDATDKRIEWTSSNPAVAEVDAEGMVRAIGTGSAVITATSCDGSGVSAQCEILVDDSTGISGIDADGVSISVSGNCIVIKGLAGGPAAVRLLSADGVCRYDAIVNGPECRIDAAKGIYILTVNGHSKKLAIR